MQSKETDSKAFTGVLGRRAAMAQTYIIGAVVLLFSIAIILYNANRLMDQVDGKISSITALAETSLASAVWQVDHDSARDFISALLEDPSVVYAQVITGREVMASMSKPDFKDRSFTYFKQNKDFKTRTVEIRKYGDWIGSFNIAISVQGIHRDILFSSAGTIGFALVLIFVITRTSIFFSQKHLFVPLKKLEESATIIAEGDLEAPIDTRLPGELGSLARVIDDMRDSMVHLIGDLKNSKDRLEEHKVSLEITVAQRTEELEQKNISLNKALKDVKDAQRASEVANHAKSRFLASMSHEIRTPMNAILGMADILQETQLSNDQARYVQVFRAAGESLLEILDDILDLSKIEAGHLSLEAIGFSLSETLDKACSVVEPKIEEKGLEFSCTIAPGVPDRLKGDPSRLKQIIINLLGNAVKFTESGQINLSIESASYRSNETLLQFAVADTGPGIQADKLDSIFDSFTQADSSTTRKYSGTGLGLAISKELVRMMGGRIWVESSLGNGSTFLFTARFTIPAKEIQLDDSELAQSGNGNSLAPLNILMFEDSKYNAFVIQTYLKNTPSKLTVAVNGEDGMAEFTSKDFDCVLMDIQMPVMDGHEAIRAIRQWEEDNGRPSTPIIAMTAFSRSEDGDKCLNSGANAYLAKPVKKSALLEALSDIDGTAIQSCEPKGIPEPTACLAPEESEETNIAELRKSIDAAHSALERKDSGSLKVLGMDIVDQGNCMAVESIINYGESLVEVATSDPSFARAGQLLSALTDYVDRLKNSSSN